MKTPHRSLELAFATLATVALSGCQGSGGFAKLQESLAEIQTNQETIVERLASLEAKFGEGPAAARPRPGEARDARARPGQPDPSATYKVPVGDAHTKGPTDALVTIVEWSDFQCPFCNRVNPTMKQIVDEYGDDVRIAFKHNPLPMHNRALPAAMAAEAAGRQGKFWEMHDLLFANARDLTDENFEKWAGELGLDVARFKKDMVDKALEKKVKEQQAEGMTVGARGTPAFFVNGRFLSGAQPFPAFKALIDEELAEAKKLVDSGTPAAKVYETVIDKGKPKV